MIARFPSTHMSADFERDYGVNAGYVQALYEEWKQDAASVDESWRALFDYFVFQTDGDPGAHLPPDVQDLQRTLSPDERNQVKALLAEHLKP